MYTSKEIDSMRALALVALLSSLPAMAGERLLGAIVSASGADTTNASTAAPFLVAPKSKITIWCNAAASVITDSNTAVTTGAGNPGLPVTAFERLPTSVGVMVRVMSTGTAADNGAVVRVAGAGAVTCYVYMRTGDEGRDGH
jgi:hypothetical protein